MFVSTHYAGKDVSMRFREGEAWKKVFGPVFTYLNSDPTGTDNPGSLWEDAKNQVFFLTFFRKEIKVSFGAIYLFVK